ncbi:MAG: hypothetical protein A2Z78_01900 [Candidatus Nealsonbacteria bacterium RBG_13_36_15]|uniref:Mur ligase central domain-containing protein n=1 Tax=Candidatus Nealsonbacteria bacterium RBG_13_36_15 TaxID=1801660 RepID=A0A1G2DYE8_9BACT|nr:MAG: hypothetical protein A2Z78_01900 [Candidatus Nealsonbacteria bacterium RBG_13_36_15]
MSLGNFVFLINSFYILAILWLIRSTKIIFFYLYLWQLKNYHVGRFLDHFQTEKGKKLIFNKPNFLKIILLVYFFTLPYFLPYLNSFFANLYSFRLISPYLNTLSLVLSYLSAVLLFFLPICLLIIYFLENLKVFFDFYKKRIKLPILTKKAVFLIFLAIIFEIGAISTFIYFEKDLIFFALWLLILDIFLPLVISAIVLFFQPLAVFFRELIIIKAKNRREFFEDLLVIGITGSYGKTSTKEFLYTILSQRFNVLKTKEHQNSEIGIAQCVLNDLKTKHEIFLVEMGAYGRGGIKKLCNIVRPKIGILTGINEQHLALFRSQKNIIKAKYELIESLPEDGLGFFNGDNKHCFDLYNKTEKTKKISNSQPNPSNFLPDIWAEKIIIRKDYIFFKACTQKGCIDCKVYLSGNHFIPNLLSAIYLAKEFGMTDKEIQEACLNIKSPKNTMNIFKGINDITVIDDSYSANPEGVIAALNYLRLYEGKKLIIMPSLIELGRASKEVHQRIGEEIGEVCDAVIVTTKDYFWDIGEGFLRKGGREENVLFTENPREIFEIIKKLWDPGDTVLLEGRVPKELINILIKQNNG